MIELTYPIQIYRTTGPIARTFLFCFISHHRCISSGVAILGIAYVVNIFSTCRIVQRELHRCHSNDASVDLIQNLVLQVNKTHKISSCIYFHWSRKTRTFAAEPISTDYSSSKSKNVSNALSHTQLNMIRETKTCFLCTFPWINVQIQKMFLHTKH